MAGLQLLLLALLVICVVITVILRTTIYQKDALFKLSAATSEGESPREPGLSAMSTLRTPVEKVSFTAIGAGMSVASTTSTPSDHLSATSSPTTSLRSPHKIVSYIYASKRTIFGSINLNELCLVHQEANHSVFVSGEILFLTLGDSERFDTKFFVASRTLGCYANHWGMAARVVDPKEVPACKAVVTLSRKVCAVRIVIEALMSPASKGLPRGAAELKLTVSPNWVVVLDEDVGILNSGINPSNVARQWENKDVVFSERFLTGEFNAGMFALRPTSNAAVFMRIWEKYTSWAVKVAFNNGHQGALQLSLVRYLVEELIAAQDPSFARKGSRNGATLVKYLETIYSRSKDVGTYDRYTAAVKLALGRKRIFEKAYIHRRGVGPFQEFNFGINRLINIAASRSPIALRFLYVQGLNWTGRVASWLGIRCVDEITTCQRTIVNCTLAKDLSLDTRVGKATREALGGLTLGLLQSVRKYEVPASQTSVSVQKNVRDFKPWRMGLGNINDASECWPDCAPEMGDSMWSRLGAGLLRNANCTDNGSTRSASCMDK